MLKMKLEFFERFGHLENTFGAYPGQACAYSCEKRCGFCGKPVSLQKRNLTSPWHTGIFSQAPWKAKCYNRSSRAIDVDTVDLSIGVDAVDHFDLLP